MTEKQRRQARRLSNAVEVCFCPESSEDSQNAVVANLSSGGVFIETEEELSEGTMLRLNFAVPTRFKQIDAVGKVVWKGTEDGRRGVGVQFVEINPIELYDLMRGVKEGGWLYALGMAGDE